MKGCTTAGAGFFMGFFNYGGKEQKMRVNGKEVPLGGRITLAEFLAAHNYRAELVAVERSGKIVPRTDFGSVILNDGDELEIVSFVGGG